MANNFYKKGLQSLLSAGLNFLSDTIKIACVDTAAYTADFSTDQYLNIIPGGDVIARSGGLSGKTITLGVFKADNATFSGVTGDTFEAIVVFKDTGTDSTSPMFLYITSYTGLPAVPIGGPLIVQWPAAGIFDLGS